MNNTAKIVNINKGQQPMPSDRGFVNLWRDIDKQPWYKNHECVAVFIHLIIKASHKPVTAYFKGNAVALSTGELYATRSLISRETGVSPDKVRRALEKFRSLGQISLTPVKNHGRVIGQIISILSWEKWQNSAQPTAQPTAQPETSEIKALNGYSAQPLAQPLAQLNNNAITNIVSKDTCKNSDEFVPNAEPNVPHQEIVNLFRQILPDLPQVKKLTDARRKSIKARHNQLFKKEIANWEKYFTYVKTNCSWMLTGNFNITFDYLIKQANVVAIMEGAKDDRR